MNWILDIVVVAVFVLSVIIGFKKGFIQSVVSLVSLLAALLVAFWMSSVVANGVYTTFVEPPIKEALVEAIGVPTDSLQGDFDRAMGALPAFAVSFMEENGITSSTLVEKLSSATFETAEQMATAIMKTVVQPAIFFLIRCIAFVILFIILLFLCKFLGKFLGGIIKHSPFKKADKLLGGVLGAVKGLLWTVVIVTVIQMIVAFSAEDALISQKTIEETKVVKVFAQINLLDSVNNNQ